MPISSVATAVANATTNTTSLTITIPAGTQTGDLLVAILVNRDDENSPSSVTDDDTGGNAWADLTGSSKLSVFYKWATSGTASKTVTASGFTGSCSGGMVVLRGADDIPQGMAGQVNLSGDETHTPGLTTTGINCWSFLAIGNVQNDLSVSSPASANLGAMTPLFEHLNTGGSDCAAYMAYVRQPNAGDTGDFTWSQTNGNGRSKIFYVPPAPSTHPIDLIGQGIIPVAR